jgi:hypothetical protein
MPSPKNRTGFEMKNGNATRASSSSALTIQVRKAPPKPSVVLDTYWKFAHERQEVYFRRIKNSQSPWTNDPILNEHKFTNTYRASDRVSQYLLRSVIYKGPQNTNDLFFRVLLFKIFNKIETWKALEEELGEIRASNFQIKRYAAVLEELRAQKISIYSAAYIMPSGGKSLRFSNKHLMHLNLLKRMLDDQLPKKLESSSSMEEAFQLLLSYPTIGDFLAYQFVTDLNYTEMLDFSEMDFVVPGPGARDGLKKCFTNLGDYDEQGAIRYVTENQDREFERLDLKFKPLWGRPLQLIDCQNIFCETDKYARVAHPEFKGRTERTRIKQKFTSHGPLEIPFFPPKWCLNEKIEKDLKKRPSAQPRAFNESFAP